MTNPVVHTVIFILAVIIPGGLGVYFAWRFMRKRNAAKDLAPEQVKQAFLRRFPKESPRAQGRAPLLNKLKLYKTRPRKKSQ